MEDTIIILAYGLSCTILGYAIAAIRHARSCHQFTRKTWAEAAVRCNVFLDHFCLRVVSFK